MKRTHDCHVTHLLTRYVHGQLRPAQRARVMNHIRRCADCRSALAREERLAAELVREMPLIGQARAGQLTEVWAGVWAEVSAPRPRPVTSRTHWLPGLSAVLVALAVSLIALPVLAQGGSRAAAAPLPPRPQLLVSTASPTPGVTDEAPFGASLPLPQATVAFAVEVGASPVPVPGITMSPAAPAGRQE